MEDCNKNEQQELVHKESGQEVCKNMGGCGRKSIRQMQDNVWRSKHKKVLERRKEFPLRHGDQRWTGRESPRQPPGKG